MIQRMGLEFELGSDRDQTVIKDFKVQNPSTQELALHAVYIVDEQGTVFYRKVARRRPGANELIDAIDAHQGRYPQHDRVTERRAVNVAYPTNNFQALLEIVRAPGLPASINAKTFAQVRQQAETIQSDDALIAYRQFMDGATQASEEELLTVAAWLARITYFDGDAEALRFGQQLDQRLTRVNELEGSLAAAKDPEQRDQVLDQLTQARALLTRTRAVINEHADEWRLRLLKTGLRSYREVAKAAVRQRDQ